MPVNNFPSPLPQAGAQIVNPSTGALTTTGYRFVSNLWNRTGAQPGSNATTFLVNASNLSDLSNKAQARTNLGLGSAATQSASAFATAAEGTAAATALQPNTTIPVTSVTIGGVQVLGPRIAGWGAASGGSRGSPSTYAGQSIGSAYSQSQVQNIDNQVKALTQAVLQMIADNKTQGFYGS